MTFFHLSCTKRYADIPFAHRQHTHEGHCAFIHGHNWCFEFVFTAHELDGNGFVVDFGTLGWIKAYIEAAFDHALVLNTTDPLAVEMKDLFGGSVLTGPGSFGTRWSKAAKILLVDNCSCEGIAAHLWYELNAELQLRTEKRVSIAQITVWEDSRNSATFKPLTRNGEVIR